MLIIKVFVNEDQIDTIHIHNEGKVETAKGYYKYKIVKPKINYSFFHYRKGGYIPLVAKVFKYLCNNKIDRKNDTKRNSKK